VLLSPIHHNRPIKFIQRQNWGQTTDVIASLTEEQLVRAVEAMKSGQKVDDPLIRRLLHMIEAIAVKLPGPFAEKLKLRAKILGLTVRYGMPDFWITINPSDL
jgi:helitron helicase-like protein